MSDQQRIEEIRDRVRLIGSWQINYYTHEIEHGPTIEDDQGNNVVTAYGTGRGISASPAALHFIAHAPDDIRWLLDALSRADVALLEAHRG